MTDILYIQYIVIYLSFFYVSRSRVTNTFNKLVLLGSPSNLLCQHIRPCKGKIRRMSYTCLIIKIGSNYRNNLYLKPFYYFCLVNKNNK